MPAATVLFELTELASYMQQDLDTASATLARDIATAVVQRSARSNVFERATTAEIVGGETVLSLLERPVTAVATVTGIDSGTVPPADYERHGHQLLLDSGTWDRYVTVTYTAGFATIPADVKGVALAVAARIYGNPAGLRSESIQDYSYTNAGTDNDLVSGVTLMPHEIAVLRRYFGGAVSLIGATP